jgi:hypothetical protein
MAETGFPKYNINTLTSRESMIRKMELGMGIEPICNNSAGHRLFTV